MHWEQILVVCQELRIKGVDCNIRLQLIPIDKQKQLGLLENKICTIEFNLFNKYIKKVFNTFL